MRNIQKLDFGSFHRWCHAQNSEWGWSEPLLRWRCWATAVNMTVLAKFTNIDNTITQKLPYTSTHLTSHLPPDENRKREKRWASKTHSQRGMMFPFWLQYISLMGDGIGTAETVRSPPILCLIELLQLKQYNLHRFMSDGIAIAEIVGSPSIYVWWNCYR